MLGQPSSEKRSRFTLSVVFHGERLGSSPSVRSLSLMLAFDDVSAFKGGHLAEFMEEPGVGRVFGSSVLTRAWGVV